MKTTLKMRNLIISVLVVLFFYSPTIIQAQTEDREGRIEGSGIAMQKGPPVFHGSIPENWWEDGEKLKRRYKSFMSPEEQRAALETTGIGALLSQPPVALSTSEAAVSHQWTSIGPFGDLANGSGRVAGIQILPYGAGYRVYAGGSSGGLWYSNSSTLGTWVNIGGQLPNPSCRAFQVDPDNYSHIVVGTGDPQRYPGAGLFVTTDGGGNWAEANISPQVIPEAFYRLYFVPTLENTLIAASDQGILRSSDDGENWTIVHSGHFTDLAIDPSEPSIMYAPQQESGIYRSDDWGISWNLISDSNLIASSDWQRASVAVSPSSPNKVALVVEKNGSVIGVFRTDNGRAETVDWIDITRDMTGFGNTQAFHVLSITFNPTNSSTIYVGVVDIAVTENNGSTWKKGPAAAIPVGHPDITQIYFNPLPDNIYMWICNDGGIYRHLVGYGTQSFNGNGSTGLALGQIDKMAANRDMIVAGLQDNGVLRSVNSGLSWDSVAYGDGGVVVITDPEANNFWYGIGVPWNIKRYLYNQSPEDVVHPGENSCPLFYDRYDDTIFSATLKKIVSRAQLGSTTTSWTDVATDLQTDPYDIWFILGNEMDGKTIFVIYRSDNKRDLTIARYVNNVWTTIHREDVAPAGSHIVHVVASDQWAREFWVLIEGAPETTKILHTVDDGMTWEDISGNLASLKVVRFLAVTPFNPLNMFAATDIGIFRTMDGGANWEPFMEGLPVVQCKRLRFVVDDNMTMNHRLVLATYGRGMYDRLVPSPPIVYVDKIYVGYEDGTSEHPYKTVAGAVAAAPTGSIIAVRGSIYEEPQQLEKSLTMVTFSRPTIIQ